MITFAAGGPLEASHFGIALWAIVTFLILFFILAKTAWPTLIKALEERENAIRADLEEAEKNRAETAKLVEDHRLAMEKAKEDARSILEQERVAGEKLRQDIVDKARDEANQIVAKAKEEIDFERQKAVEALRRESVNLSMDAAGKVLGRAITDDDHRRLVEETMADLGKLQSGKLN